jgi:hypothetical protein
VLQEIANATNHSPWAGQKLRWMALDGYLPNEEQNGNKREWAEPDEQSQSSPVPCRSRLGALPRLLSQPVRAPSVLLVVDRLPSIPGNYHRRDKCLNSIKQLGP